MKKGPRPGFAGLSLVISLLIVALIAFLVISYLVGQRGQMSGGVVSPIQRAKNVECLAQIEKIEMQVNLYSVQNGKYPENLGELDDLLESDLRCPVTGNAYLYDSESGRVSCQDHRR